MKTNITLKHRKVMYTILPVPHCRDPGKCLTYSQSSQTASFYQIPISDHVQTVQFWRAPRSNSPSTPVTFS